MTQQIISDKQIGGHKGTTKTPRAKPKQLERVEQKAVIKWAKWQKYGQHKVADLLHHSPNGGKRDAREGKHFKEMGTLAGFPDLFLFVARHGFNGLLIEMKQKGGKASDVSDSQNAIAERLTKHGYKFVVCFGANHAIDEIKQYLFGGDCGQR